jgi:hypothetical protein
MHSTLTRSCSVPGAIARPEGVKDTIKRDSRGNTIATSKIVTSIDPITPIVPPGLSKLISPNKGLAFEEFSSLQSIDSYAELMLSNVSSG